MAKLGATEFEISQELGIGAATLRRWKVNYPEFAEALLIGKEPADNRMEYSLYQRGLGYSHLEEKHFVIDGKIVTIETVKHYPPDTAAAFIWLQNRRPDIWRQRRENVNNLGEQTNEELRTVAQRLRAFSDEIDVLTDAPAQSNQPDAVGDEAGTDDAGSVVIQNEPLDPA